MNIITLENLMENMKVKLQAFNNEKLDISNETIHNDILASDDGFRPSISSMNLYKGAILWTVRSNGGNKFKFPSGWMGMTVQELAEDIISKQTTL